MRLVNGTNLTVKNLEFNNKTLLISFIYKYRGNENILCLLLKERNTEQVISVNLIKNESLDEDGLVFSAEIDINKTFAGSNIGTIWDFYVNVESDNHEKLMRVKSIEGEIELFYYRLEESRRIAVPYTTVRGNLSIEILEYGNISKVDEILINEDKQLVINGYALPLNIDEENHNTIKTLIIEDQKTQNRILIPIESIERPDLSEIYGKINNRNFDHVGFKVKINLKEILLNNDTQSFLLYVEMKHREEEYESIIGPSVLKYKYTENLFKDFSFIKVGGKRKKVTVYTNKKSNNLRINFENRMDFKKIFKKFFITVKRHPRVKKTYVNLFKFIGLFPSNKKLIIFESFLGKQYSCNPRAIYEYLEQSHSGYKMYWSVDKKYFRNFENNDLNIVKRFSIKWLFLMANARFWVTNSRMPIWIPKPKHTIYIQTWHGTPLKRLASDMNEVHMPGTTTEKYKNNFYKESRNWDYLISPNAYSTEIFKRAFQFNKSIIETGYPRNDYLYKLNDSKEVIRLKTKYDIPLNKKIILYAPTFRDNQFYGKGRYKFNLDLDLNILKEELDDQYVILLRLHYLVAEKLNLTDYGDFVYDFSNHEDIRELYLLADLLITDYSSVFFDYANLKRPIIFYVHDIELYRDKLRGFYFDIEKYAPGPLVETTEGVINAINKLEKVDFEVDIAFDEFMNKYCYLESGQSAKRVVNEVLMNVNQ